MKNKKNLNSNSMNIESFASISIKEHNINKILLLNNTHNLVCSYGEDCQVEIFSLNFQNTNGIGQYHSLQTILDPHYYSIEYIYETKKNSHNENYLLLCSDMIHVFYLYDNDTKSNLLQSINEFNYRFICQVIELRNGNLISYSNEYKISLFTNLLIENEEYISKNDIISKNYKKEIYELEMDKLNKNNEIILYLLELYPNKFAYCYKIDDGEFTKFLNEGNEEEENEEEEEEKDESNINNNSDEYIYIKFMDKEYNIITEIQISKVNKDIYNMFQYNENTMIFINSSFLSIIDLKYYEKVTTIKTNLISMAYFFTNSFINNNFINYLILKINKLKEEESTLSEDDDNNENNEEDSINNNYDIYNNDEDNNIPDDENNNIIYGENDINFYDLTDLEYGIKKIKCYYKNNRVINLNDFFIPDKILDISVICDNKDKNCYYLSVFNNDLSISFSKINISN